jgi:hypothetical protein
MRFRGILTEVDFDFNRGSHFVKLVIDSGNIEEVNKYKGRRLSVEIKELEHAKTPSQNRFFWEIVSKMADVLNTSKEEVYQHLLSHYGTPVAELKAEKAKDVLGTDLHYVIQKSGRKYNYYLVIKGISLMSSKEMTAFIRHTLDEAAELNIDTVPPYEWERLQGLWNR